MCLATLEVFKFNQVFLCFQCNRICGGFQYIEVDLLTPKVFVVFPIQSGDFATPEVFPFCLVD